MQNEIKIDKLIRSRRRSIALIIAPDAALIVRAPMKISLAYIQDLIFRKRGWIDRKKRQALEGGTLTKAKEFIDGEEFLYLGNKYRLKIEIGEEIKLTNYLSFPEKYLVAARTKMIEWYKRLAREKITERAKVISRTTGWEFKSVAITNARSRWGSCSARGSINFSWRLIMAPLEIIDYVVVHELAHTVERNHSIKFWRKVEAALPDYKTRRDWLKHHGAAFKI